VCSVVVLNQELGGPLPRVWKTHPALPLGHHRRSASNASNAVPVTASLPVTLLAISLLHFLFIESRVGSLHLLYLPGNVASSMSESIYFFLKTPWEDTTKTTTMSGISTAKPPPPRRRSCTYALARQYQSGGAHAWCSVRGRVGERDAAVLLQISFRELPSLPPALLSLCLFSDHPPPSPSRRARSPCILSVGHGIWSCTVLSSAAAAGAAAAAILMAAGARAASW
jgi:hypothetical protein